MIIETLVTTIGPEGRLNVAPMGVEWGEDELVIRPFVDTETFRNLAAIRQGVANLTDDALLFAQAVIHHPAATEPPTDPARKVTGAVLRAACSWREFEVTGVDDTPPRSRLHARVVYRGSQREFLGFNRARHAVLEAAIIVTRTHLILAEEVDRELARLQVIVDKTAGPAETLAMRLLTEYVASQRNGGGTP